MDALRVRFLAPGRTTRRRPLIVTLAAAAAVGLVAGALSLPVALATVSSGDKSIFVQVTPTRILDTRVNLGLTGKFSSGASRLLQVTGSVPVAPSGTATVVPAGATAVVLNVTAVSPTRNGFVAVRPGDAAGSPTTSSLNVLAGQTIPNAVTVGLPTGGGSAGKIQLWYQGSGSGGVADLLVDVVGYYDDHNHDDRYYTETQTKALVFDHQTLTGRIGSDGTKGDNGPYTSSRSGTGTYFATYDLTGQGVKTSHLYPHVTATASWLCANGISVQADWASVSSLGSDVLSMTIEIETFNGVGVSVDCTTIYNINFTPSSTVGVPEPAAPAAAAKPGQRVTCKNTESGPVCTSD